VSNPDGLVPIRYLHSKETVYPDADWRLALVPEIQVGWVSFEGATPVESALLLDRPEKELQVAGFLVTRAASGTSALAELDRALAALGDAATVTTRASGRNIRSLDGFDTVVGTTLEVGKRGISDVTVLRRELLPVLL